MILAPSGDGQGASLTPRRTRPYHESWRRGRDDAGSLRGHEEARMSQLMKGAVAELLGLFFFTFVGAGAICLNAANPGAGGLLAIALAHGIMMAINVAALGAIS